MIDFSTPGEVDRLQIAIKNGINDASFRKQSVRRSHRLSPSWLGEKCVAASWYKYRWAMKPQPNDGRMARYNSKGDPEEEIIADLLRESGWTVRTHDENGDQFAVSDLNGHLYGRVDGLASHPEFTNGVEILFENKYINTRRFVALTKEPLIKADPKYYGQVCLYLKLLNLPAALFMPGNRNDSDIQPILIPRDDSYAENLLRTGENIMFAKVRPARIAENPAYFECKMCDLVSVCHSGAPLDINCRSCINAEPITGGKWKCNKWNAVIPNKEAMEAACSDWQPIA